MAFASDLKKTLLQALVEGFLIFYAIICDLFTPFALIFFIHYNIGLGIDYSEKFH